MNCSLIALNTNQITIQNQKIFETNAIQALIHVLSLYPLETYKILADFGQEFL